MARFEGLILDPVYTAKVFAAIRALVASGAIPPGARVCFWHTGGLASLFAYEQEIRRVLGLRAPCGEAADPGACNSPASQ